jgi:hypothetical protein
MGDGDGGMGTVGGGVLVVLATSPFNSFWHELNNSSQQQQKK